MNKNVNKGMDIEVYSFYNQYGTIIEVNNKKIPLNKNWQNQVKSDEFKSDSNYAVVPNKKLCIIDIDTKKGGIGDKTFQTLCNTIGLPNFPKQPTVTTPSGGKHYYLVDWDGLDLPVGMRRTFRDLKDIEFITGWKKGYSLLPSNKGIISKDSSGKTIKSEYFENELDPIDMNDGIDFITPFVEKYLKIQHSRMFEETKEKEKVKVKIDDDFYKTTKGDVEPLLDWLDSSDYHEWVAIGGHIKKAMGENGKELFINWSLDSDNTTTRDKIEKKWKNLPIDDGEGLPSLVYLAKEEKLRAFKASKDNDYKLELIRSYPELDKGFTKNEVKEHVENNKELKKEVEKENKYEFAFPNAGIQYEEFLLGMIKKGKEMIINTVQDIEQVDLMKKVLHRLKFINGKLHLVNYDNMTISKIDNANHPNYIQRVLAGMKELQNKDNLYVIKLKSLLETLIALGDNDNYKMIEVESTNRYGFEFDHKNKIFTKFISVKSLELPKVDISEEEEYKVINAYNKHFFGYDMILLKWGVTGSYMQDMKDNSLAFLANSDYGKNFHFGILDNMKIGSYVKINDFCLNGAGINNTPMEKITKMVNIFDETGFIPRNFFEVNNSILYRGMRQSAIELNIGNRIFLNADGGQFNDDSLDDQIMNRIKILDFRVTKSKIKNLYGYEKYGKNKYYAIIYNYYKEELLQYIKELDDNDFFYKADLYEALDNQVKNIKLIDPKSLVDLTLDDKKINFFEKLDLTILRMLANFDLFDRYTRNILLEHAVYHKQSNSIVIKNASKNLEELVISIDEEMRKEMKYKKIKNIAHNCELVNDSKTYKVNGKNVYGISIPLDGLEVDDELLDHIK